MDELIDAETYTKRENIWLIIYGNVEAFTILRFLRSFHKASKLQIC